MCFTSTLLNVLSFIAILIEVGFDPIQTSSAQVIS